MCGASLGRVSASKHYLCLIPCSMGFLSSIYPHQRGGALASSSLAGPDRGFPGQNIAPPSSGYPM